MLKNKQKVCVANSVDCSLFLWQNPISRQIFSCEFAVVPDSRHVYGEYVTTMRVQIMKRKKKHWTLSENFMNTCCSIVYLCNVR
jgi:hypothetical protein